MTICAYCEHDRPATREHVIPSFIYAFQKQVEQSFIGWNEVANRMVGGEAKIKDVCGECNNGTLGQLDSYAKQMLSDSGLLVQNYKDTSLCLGYDYPLLLRWLLKVSFNSSRADGVHAAIFKEHIPFILGLAPPPPRYRVATVLYLAAPELISKNLAIPESFVKASQGSNVLNPFFARISYGVVPSDRFIHRINILGPAVFHLLLFKEGVLPGHAASEIRSLIKVQPEAVELSSKRRVVSLKAGKQSWLDLYAPQAIRAGAIADGSFGANN